MMHDPLMAYLEAFARRHIRRRDGRPATAADLTEAQRIAAVKARGVTPEACGPAIPDAPARTGYVPFQPMVALPVGEDGVQVVPGGYRGRDALRAADAFDRMAAAYARQRQPLPFSESQVRIGRLYAAMAEREAAKGTPRSCLADSGKGEAADYLQTAIDASRRLDLMRRRIGAGMAKAIRRRRPSERRVGITDRALVDAVCLGGMTLVEVLRGHGWVDRNGRPRQSHVDDLALALADALDRMMGPQRRPGPTHMRTDHPAPPWPLKKTS